MVPYSFASTSHFILTFFISFTVVLGATILRAHVLLNILSSFAYNIMTSGFIFFFIGLVPLAFIIAFSVSEVAIVFIQAQAQVFVVLTTSYVKDALDLH